MRNWPWTWLMLTAASFLAAGAVDRTLEAKPDLARGANLVHAILVAVFASSWCKAHARSHQIAEPGGSAVICFLFAPLGVPLYLFRAFGAKRAIFGTAKAVAFLILCIAPDLMDTELPVITRRPRPGC
jgi:hypothetical protein